MKRVLILSLILMVVIVVAACGDDDKDDKTGDTSLELTQTGTVEAPNLGSFTFAYPVEWTFFNGYFLVSHEQAFEHIWSAGLKDGEVAVQFSIDPAGAFGSQNAAEFVTRKLGPMAVDEGFMFSTIAAHTTGTGLQAARVEGVKSGAYKMLGIGVQTASGHYLTLTAYTVEDEFAQYEPVFLAIVDSFVYTPPAE
jgi:hypothetical protein